ncbi:hypothetical protein [Vulgatibacter sp.]|uniref:pilus assembly PilX family protein n=1 Tax=Vulgatibacter sp. TaxID=1971226 RepID=UPI00356A153B
MLPKNERGFSLLIGMLILVVLAIVGATAVMSSIGEEGTATSRLMRRQALTAAEAGVHHFMGLQQPATPAANGFYIGNDGAGVDAWQWLPEVRGPRNEVLQPRYQVLRDPNQPAIADTTLVLIRGQVMSGGNVVGRANLHALVEASPGGGGGPTEQGQKSTGPLGGSSTIPVVSDISLIFN